MDTKDLNNNISKQIALYLSNSMSYAEKLKFEQKMASDENLKKEVQRKALVLESKQDFISRTLYNLENQIHDFPRRRYHVGKALNNSKALIYLIGIIIAAALLTIFWAIY